MKSYSILREEEYKQLRSLSLDGNILDVGGSKKSGYQNLIKGKNSFFVINIDKNCEPDLEVDIEKIFPFENESFDHAVCLNVLEHVFEVQHVFSEQVRCVKKGGSLVVATPFIHHIHASPDDYLRYTSSFYERLAKKNNCTIETITPLGEGFFSLCFQCIGGKIPTFYLKFIFKKIFISIDRFLNKFSSKYRKLTSTIPLGYFVVFRK
jgi:SAM-dependent methyltransferase